MMNSRLSAIGVVSIAYLLAGPALGQPGEEQAGSCTEATRGATKAGGWSVRTIFVAETEGHKVFEVTVFRNGKQQNQKYITSGDPKRQTMQTTMVENVYNSTKDVDVVAEIIR